MMNTLSNQLNVVILLFLISLSSQKTLANDDPLIGYRFKVRTAFRVVNSDYQFESKVTYYVDAGFKIHEGFDEIEIEDELYYILRYPNYSEEAVFQRLKGKTTEAEPELGVNIMMTDSSDTDLAPPLHQELYGINGKLLAIKKAKLDEMIKAGEVESIYGLWYGNRGEFATGLLTVPFKFRPGKNGENFSMTTDITIGSYLGYKRRIHRTKDHFVIFTGTLGLSYINLNTNNTSNTEFEDLTGVVPGVSWSTGLIFDLDGYNVGLLTGQDYASGIGESWKHQGDWWISFAIGYTFFSSGK